MDPQTLEFTIEQKRRQLDRLRVDIDRLQQEYSRITMEIADLVDALKRRNAPVPSWFRGIIQGDGGS